MNKTCHTHIEIYTNTCIHIYLHVHIYATGVGVHVLQHAHVLVRMCQVDILKSQHVSVLQYAAVCCSVWSLNLEFAGRHFAKVSLQLVAKSIV